MTHGLSLVGEPAVEALTQALTHNNEDVRAHAAFALGDMGGQAESSVSSLTKAVTDESPWVRHHAVEALGTIANHADTAVPALAHALTHDDDGQVRYNAAYALACFGTEAAEAVPALTQALNDPNRYTSGHAIAALRRIRTPQAIDTLLHWMETTRWCPVTTKDNTF
ncbi:MAG: HEAT repeat domain-containing protein [Candidatus Latescibacteria bacterium]|jgi:HEAT repeat protein|nr:HEAT repeat domain-containing protein [Candidatus Latescibacterota bacterium]MBT4141009.1 HEAT repeat domain-containing protein [Candidatus Latescibacterota bacterium]MBT5829073.1 HEAT repeat domain-containing protein [Candidatus Latescibacterota bacterium]